MDGEFSDPLVFIPELPSQPKPSSGLVAASPCPLLLGCFLSSLLRKLVGRLNAHLHPDVWIALGYLPSAWGCAAHHCVKADVWSQAANHEGKPAFGWGSASVGAWGGPGRAVFIPKATSLLRFGRLCLQNSPLSSLLQAGGAGGALHGIPWAGAGSGCRSCPCSPGREDADPKGVYLGDLLLQEVYRAGTRAGFPSIHLILQPWGLPCAPASLSASHCFSRS